MSRGAERSRLVVSVHDVAPASAAETARWCADVDALGIPVSLVRIALHPDDLHRPGLRDATLRAIESVLRVGAQAMTYADVVAMEDPAGTPGDPRPGGRQAGGATG